MYLNWLAILIAVISIWSAHSKISRVANACDKEIHRLDQRINYTQQEQQKLKNDLKNRIYDLEEEVKELKKQLAQKSAKKPVKKIQ